MDVLPSSRFPGYWVGLRGDEFHVGILCEGNAVQILTAIQFVGPFPYIPRCLVFGNSS